MRYQTSLLRPPLRRGDKPIEAMHLPNAPYEGTEWESIKGNLELYLQAKP
jgi:hypothetical protein